MRPESTILFVGYQALGTLGRNIIECVPEVRLFGETISVKAHIEELAGVSGLPAHPADITFVPLCCKVR